MYQPMFNSVLVEIDDADAKWGGGNDESMLGKSYSKGVFVELGVITPQRDYPFTDMEEKEAVRQLIAALQGKAITWNEGAEAGTTFEDGGKLYGFIYWSDIRGVQA